MRIDPHAILAEVHERMASFEEEERSVGCLYYAAAVCQTLRQRGVRAILQAGEAQWPRLRPEQDDGVSPTHFGYVWEPHSPTTLARLAQNLLPELHCWAGIPATHEIIDPTTRYWPQRCQAALGRDWPGDRPPDDLWCKGEELPPGVVYRPALGAIRVVMRYLRLTEPAWYWAAL
jgi:hypothetical protein